MKKIITASAAGILCLATVISSAMSLNKGKLSNDIINADLLAAESKTVTVEDNYLGTLNYVENNDGTVTVSYKVNGEDRSYTFVNDPIYTSGGYAATDDVDRTLPTATTTGVIGENGEHYVGIFYFLWMGEHGDWGAYNLEEIRQKYGDNAKLANYVDPETKKSIYGPVGAMHHFAEPLYGYYYSSDEWVMRKHIELLTNAGIDFLFLDATNSYTYASSAIKLMKIIHEYNEMGYNPPKIVFYTNSNSIGTMSNIYDQIYKSKIYPDTWFYVDGKPCIIGDSAQATNTNDIKKLETLKKFFTVKESQWPNDYANPLKDNAWPWMSFAWPQGVHKDAEGNPSAINVAIAQHSGSVCFSHSSLYFTASNESNRGRSYNGEASMSTYRTRWNKDNSRSNLGLNFQKQWNTALKADVPYVLITGWNEWVAQRQADNNNQVIFIDTASVEFSRDAEMMKGGYFDNYYMQIIYNIQRLKGSAPIIVQDNRNHIDVNGEFTQWNDVLINYQDGEGDTVDRNGKGFGKVTYTDNSGRNDIVSAKVTNDTKKLYFYVETKEDIQPSDGNSSWMQLFVNTDMDQKNGWYGYDFIINNADLGNGKTTVAKYTGEDGSFDFEDIGEVSYKIDGNKMMIEVPLETLGYEDYRQVYLEFKWADTDEGHYYENMEDFYLYGDVAPAGRLNYIYQNYIPGESVFNDNDDSSNGEVSTGDETTTAAPTDTVEETESTAEEVTTAEEKSGCGAVISGISAISTLALSALVIAKKKKED